jgi:hypothetical protein
MAIKKVSRVEVDFSDIFEFAERDPWGIGWNEANDVFFNNTLDYKRYNDFYKGDLEYDLEERQKKEKGEESGYERDRRIGQEVILAFMKENNLDEIRVMND